MSSLTLYTEKKLVDHLLGKTTWTMATPVYLGLFKASPGESGSQTDEVSGGSYARVSITSLMGAADSSTGEAENSSAITFASPTADWGTVTHVGILDASSAGNMLAYEALAEPIDVVSGGDAPSFPAGDFNVAGL